MIAVLIIICVFVVLLVFIIGAYNSLVGFRNQVKNAWAQIDVQLKRRYDLIPNLVEAVKGYAKHERETFEMVTKARNLAQQAASAGAAERGKLEGELGMALGRLLAIAEAYPELKANQNFLPLQKERTPTENKISFSRQFYNDSVLRFNNKIQMFPSNVIAGMFNFKTGEFFEVNVPEQREAPKVSFT